MASLEGNFAHGEGLVGEFQGEALAGKRDQLTGEPLDEAQSSASTVDVGAKYAKL